MTLETKSASEDILELKLWNNPFMFRNTQEKEFAWNLNSKFTPISSCFAETVLVEYFFHKHFFFINM